MATLKRNKRRTGEISRDEQVSNECPNDFVLKKLFDSEFLYFVSFAPNFDFSRPYVA